MEKLRLNNMTTNLPAKTATAMVVPAAAAAEMVVIGSGRRVWMGRRLQSLRRNDATDPQPNGQRRPVVVPTAAATDHPAAMSDDSGATKTTRKTNVGPWQQGNNTGGFDDGGDNGPSSSPADREDNDAAAGNDQGNATAADVNRGDEDAGTSSVVLAASNTPDHDNDADDDDADAKDAAGKKTLMREATAAETGGGALALAVILPLRNDDIGGGLYDSASALSVAPCSCNDDEAP